MPSGVVTCLMSIAAAGAIDRPEKDGSKQRSGGASFGVSTGVSTEVTSRVAENMARRGHDVGRRDGGDAPGQSSTSATVPPVLSAAP